MLGLHTLKTLAPYHRALAGTNEQIDNIFNFII